MTLPDDGPLPGCLTSIIGLVVVVCVQRGVTTWFGFAPDLPAALSNATEAIEEYAL